MLIELKEYLRNETKLRKVEELTALNLPYKFFLLPPPPTRKDEKTFRVDY